MSKRILVTAALPYANGPLHLGHIAGAYLPSDLYVRYKRLVQEEVLFICGSDEHGVPITIAADKEGVSPQDIVDRYHAINKKAFEDFGISFDYYGRTSSPTHRKVSQDFFRHLHKQGIFRKKTEKQYYDESASMFLADRYIKGTCPKCGFEEAYGDQCEKCGSSLTPSELINPVSMLSGNQPVLRETEHWYIPLGDFQEWLESWIDGREGWKPNVLGQCKSWLDSGLADRAVTRDLPWGVPVPLDEAKGKVLYVWFDAPIGYISATVEWAALTGNPDDWKLFWQDDETELVHFIGKDNIVFHCIMFPAMLKAHGSYVLPKHVPANEFLNLEGRKLSTSRGWAVWLHEYLEDFQPDLLRYVLTAIMPETKDSDFSWKDFQGRVNNDLADVFGNFVFRTLSFTHRFFDGKVPSPENPSDEDLEMLAMIGKQKKVISEAWEAFRFKEAAAETLNLARAGNVYFTASEPWKTSKSDPQKCANTIYVCLQICGALSIFFEPLVPAAASKLRGQLGLDGIPDWEMAKDGMLKPGSGVSQGEILFRKIEDAEIERQIEKLNEKAAKASPSKMQFPEEKASIEFENFAALDLRAGKVTHAEKIPKSKKLLKLTVDLGYETRTVVSGIAEYFEPADVLGKQVTVVANLQPRKIMGVESKGMILMAHDPGHGLRFVLADAHPGSAIS